MKVDIYTKTVLTIIAFCLIIIAFKGTQTVEAYDNITRYGDVYSDVLRAIRNEQPIEVSGSVEIDGQPIEVNIKQNGFQLYPVEVEDIE